jgi:tetratricopeptide (TPR) repeat protein
MNVEPFAGRSAERAHLRDLAAEVTSTGVGRFVLVAGEAGAGKTRLCAEVARELADDRMASAWSRCWDGGGVPPLWPWPDLVGELARQHGTSPPLLSSNAVPDRFGLFRHVVDQLRAVVVDRPAVALLDDLHAANDDAVLLTRFIVRSLHRFPLLVVATWRTDRTPGAASPASLEALARDATVINLRPFGEHEIAAYLRLLRDRDPTVEEVTELLAATGGNPLYLVELVRRPSLDERERAAGLQNVLQRRVRDLSARRRQVLSAAAVLGAGARVEEVAEVTGCAPSDILELVGDDSSGVAIVSGRFRFSHDLIREAFVAELSAAERQELHAAATDAIHGTNSDQAVRRARHAVEVASVSRDHRATAIAACAACAGTLTRDLAFEQAAEWAGRGWSLAVGTSPPAIEAELLLDQARSVLACGRLTEARHLYDRAVTPALLADDPRLLALAALGLGGVWVEEQRDELSRRRLLSLCRQAMAVLGPDDRVLRARLEVRLAAEDAYDLVPDSDVRGAVDEVRQLGDHGATAEALSLYHHTLLAPAHAHLRLDVAGELLDEAARVDGTIYSLFGLCWRTVDLYLLGDQRAERSFEELRERSTALGSRSIGYIAAVIDVMRTFRGGELDRAEAMAGEALTLGQAIGDADAFGYYGGHVLGIRWAQGRLQEMHQTVTEVMASATLRRRDRIYPALLAYTCALRGDHTAARLHVDGVLADGVEPVIQSSIGAATMVILIETAAAIGDGVLAGELGGHLAPYAHLPVVPSLAVMCMGPGERALGTAHAAAGRLDEAVACLRAALRANRKLQNRPFDAIIRAQLAAVLAQRGADGDHGEAALLYAAAIAAGADMGLTARVSAWESELAMVGGVRRSIVAVPGRLERLDGAWRIEIDGRSATIDHSVGMGHLAELVARPDTDLAAADLSAAATGEPTIPLSRGAPALDPQAVADYQRRLGELDRELDVADLLGDAARAQRAVDERGALLDCLRRDTGLDGRARRLSDDTERCRMRVSKAIRRAIARLQEADAVLGRALETRIRTGHVCRYVTDPGQPIAWTVRAGDTTARR